MNRINHQITSTDGQLNTNEKITMNVGNSPTKKCLISIDNLTGHYWEAQNPQDLQG